MKGKTTIFRIIAALALALIISVSASVVAFAQEYPELVAENTENSHTDSEKTDISDMNMEQVEQNAPENSPVVGEVSKTDEVNIFEEIYKKASEYAAEIISVLTFVGTLIVGFAYKKGLLPLVTRAVTAIQSAVNKIKNDTEESAKASATGMEGISERLAGVENSLSILTDDLMEMSAKLECESEAIKERRKMKTILLSQVDMLYDIFMSSSLPQYQKDATGARMQSMREELTAYEAGEKQ